MFSVVISLYNKELSIKNTIQSVLNQTFQDFEILVVNDGSFDNSLVVAESINDSRIRIISKQNGGVSSARNRGIREAKFKWIAFLDGDDIWLDNHLEILSLMVKEYPKYKVFSTSFIRSNEEIGKNMNQSVIVINDYFEKAIEYQFFCSSVACIDSELFYSVGFFDEQFSRGEDVKMWESIGRHYVFVLSLKITAIYKVDSENKLTKAKFCYSNSSLFDVHKRFAYFTRNSEKKFYIKKMLRYCIVFAYRLDFKSFFKTIYRLIVILNKKIKNV